PQFPNRLMKVVDQSASPKGFADGANTDDDYAYDASGNLTEDKNKGITSIAYNHLNLPVKVVFGSESNRIEYLYAADGRKLKKLVPYPNPQAAGGMGFTAMDYLDGFHYQDGSLKYFPTAEGYVQKTLSVYSYVYNYADHLGNVRMSYAEDPENPGTLKVIEENHYYPFGLKHARYNSTVLEFAGRQGSVVLRAAAAPANPAPVLGYAYRYNSKEYQDELGLNWYDYGWRNYDPAIARWTTMDPLLNDLKFAFNDSDVDEDDEDEVYEALVTKLETADGIYNTNNLNPYGYGYNNPVSFDDPDGRCPWCVVFAALLLSQSSEAPTGNLKINTQSRNATAGQGSLIPSMILGGGAGSIFTNASRATFLSKTLEKGNNKKAETLAKNQEKGKKFEDKVGKDLEKAGNKNIQGQVTIKPNGGKGNVKMDKVSTKDGKIVLTEAKSSKTAPLTKNQKEGFPLIERNGGTVRGKGKPGYPGGTKIPPTKVNIVRPGE
ncbi:MAG TPA: hypothetical protein VFR70_01615, partial [Flavobacterium sp.]|nr:hypothetical protein [Flavobacterium sp.]